jgi:glucose-1-phosphate cytidylyltransferase
MKVLILAGGFGTRLSEETGIKPKPMVEIGGKPIIWHILKIYSHYGFNDFIILLGYKGYVIKEYFANYLLHTSNVVIDTAKNSMEIIDHKTDKWKVTLLETGLNTMTGGRIKQAEKIVNGEDFLLTYGDGVSDVDIAKTVDFHNSHDGILTMTSVQPQSRYGNIRFSDEGHHTMVKSFQEKPKGERGWINGGFFVCSPQVFDYIPNDMSVSFESTPLENISADGKLFAYKHDKFWLAMDSLRDKNDLEKLWKSNNAKWKVWND